MRWRTVVALAASLPILAHANTLSELDQFGCVAGQALRLDVVGVEECFSASGSGGGNWTTIWKPETDTNTVGLTNDDDLHFTMAPNTRYAVRGVIFFEGEELTGFRYTFLCPGLNETMWDSQWTIPDNTSQTASPKNIADERRVDGDFGNVSGTCAVEEQAYRSVTWSTPASPNLGRITIRGLMDTGSSAETFRFLWGADTGFGSANVLAGSYIEYTTF